MTEDERRSAYIGFRCMPELKARLEQKAKADRRSLSVYVEMILEQHIAAADDDKPKRKR